MFGFLFTWQAAVAGAALAFAAGGWLGYDYRDARCDADEAKAQLEAVKTERDKAILERDAAQSAAKAANAASNSISERVVQRNEHIRKLEKTLASRQASDRCRLSADGLKRLLEISPN